TNVVTKVNAVARRRRVREPAAQPPVWRPGRAAVGGESAVVFGIVVGNHVGSPWTGHAVIIATIVEPYCHDSGRGIESSIMQELSVRSRIVVHAYRRAPRRAIISRCAHLNIGVVVFVDGLVCVNQIDPVVEWSTRRVPYHSSLSVD